MSAEDFLWSLGSTYGPVRVADVGANPIEGDAPYKALLAAGHAEVVGFEPQPEALDELNRRKSAAETYLPDALGDGGEVDLRIYAQSGFTSVFDVRPDVAGLIGFRRGTKQVGQVHIATRRLDDIAEIAVIDFLKIDVQGSELAIIRNGRAKLANAVLIQTEVRFLPLYQSEPTFGDLERELGDQGFLFHDFAFLKRRPLTTRTAAALRPRAFRQVVDGDAFFVRDLTRVDEMAPEQLWRLALLAHSVVRSPNLALFCLEALEARAAVAAGSADAYLALLPAEWRREVVNV